VTPAIVIVLALVALAAIVLYVVRQQARQRERIDEELGARRSFTLEYAVPAGQDPTVILAALTRSGYTATVDPRRAHQHVLVACPAGADRERARVRATIESASVTAPEDGVPPAAEVRFVDE
jgi:hypothetical protein